MRQRRSILRGIVLILVILIGAGAWYSLRRAQPALSLGLGQSGQSVSVTSQAPLSFDGERAYQDVKYQVDLGPRISGTEAHNQIIRWIQDRLKSYGWQVEVQATQAGGHPIQNVIAKRGIGKPWIILGAHYDSRLWASQDPDVSKRKTPVPGANDGASGVAVLLELGKVLPQDLHKTIWLVFFDEEDNGEIPGYDWLLGSRAFVASLAEKPDEAIIVDMIGDKDLNIFMERNSNPAITNQIWNQANALGYGSYLIPQYKYSMEDDHTPFLQVGIPAVDIIDFDYPAWHTTTDLPDQVSAKSLQVVGETLRMWLIHD